MMVLIITSGSHWISIAGPISNATCLVIALGRHGLLGAISFFLCFNTIWQFRITFDPSSFYFLQSMSAIAVTVGLAVCAFYISIAGQSILGGSILNKIEKN